MTQPTLIFMGPDGGVGHLKVYFRTLLFSTGKRGHIVDNMYITMNRGESRQNFPIWIFGEENVSRGSGLFVGFEGVTANHHFTLPHDGTDMHLVQGSYSIETFATLPNRRKPIKLSQVSLSISANQEIQLKEKGTGIFFNWGPDSQTYISHVEAYKTEKEPNI